MKGTLGWRIFLRSLLVQSSWNFAGMQNLGFYYMTWPALARRPLAPDERGRAAARHLKNFNTHPYFAGLVAATVLQSEERGAGDDAVESLKRSLMCALGAVGDEFFWASLRPFAALIALPAALAGAPWAPLLMLVVYNVPHLLVRGWGIAAGLRGGSAVVGLLQRRPLSRALPVLGAASAGLTGLVLGATAFDPSWGLLPGRGLISIGVALAAFLALVAAVRRGVGEGRLLAGLAALAALAGVARVVTAP
jgi:PTS system mannose-specific IID component